MSSRDNREWRAKAKGCRYRFRESFGSTRHWLCQYLFGVPRCMERTCPFAFWWAKGQRLEETRDEEQTA